MDMAQRMLTEALRRDPDCSAEAKQALKRIKLQQSSKEAGNTAFRYMTSRGDPRHHIVPC